MLRRSFASCLRQRTRSIATSKSTKRLSKTSGLRSPGFEVGLDDDKIELAVVKERAPSTRTKEDDFRVCAEEQTETERQRGHRPKII